MVFDFQMLKQQSGITKLCCLECSHISVTFFSIFHKHFRFFFVFYFTFKRYKIHRMTQNAFRFIIAFLLKEMTQFISSCIHVGLIQVLQFPPTSQKHASQWIGYAQLPLVVNECVHCFLQ